MANDILARTFHDFPLIQPPRQVIISPSLERNVSISRGSHAETGV